MLEEDIRRDVQGALKLLGFDPIHIPDTGQTESNRPDIIAIDMVNRPIIIEVKRAEVKQWKRGAWAGKSAAAFYAGQIPDRQRAYLDRYAWMAGDDTYDRFAVWLAIGTYGERDRRIYVIPWLGYARHEANIIAKLGTGVIPIDPVPGKPLLSIEEWYGDCKLEKGRWAIWPGGAFGGKNPVASFRFGESHPLVKSLSALRVRKDSQAEDWPILSYRKEMQK